MRRRRSPPAMSDRHRRNAMQMFRRTAVALLATAVLTGSTATAAGAFPSGAKSFASSSLAPSVPSDPALHGVAAGGAPWVLKASEVHIDGNGHMRVVIRGLIIPELGTPGPVSTVAASLYCANDTTPVASTQSVPISQAGNAVIVAKVALPSLCQIPAVVINPNGKSSVYIAATGFESPSTSVFDQPLLTTSLAPSVPSDPTLNGVKPGGLPWVIGHGAFALFGHDLVVLIRGLIIPELGTPGPVTTVEASVYCANETTAAATTQSVSISAGGNARIVARVTLPSLCLSPAVLINPNGAGSVYIATSGFSE